MLLNNTRSSIFRSFLYYGLPVWMLFDVRYPLRTVVAADRFEDVSWTFRSDPYLRLKTQRAWLF
jgi:hypothetical protein